MSLIVRGVTFEPNGAAVVEYADTEQDAKANGVLLNHTLYVPAGVDYDEEMDAVLAAVIALVRDVREDLPFLEPIRTRPNDDDDEDDDDEDDDDEDDDDEEGDEGDGEPGAGA